MTQVTRFYVERQAKGATVPDPEVFRDRDAAMRRAAWIGRRTPTRVYRVSGDAVTDLWGKPLIVAEFDGEPLQPEPTNVLRMPTQRKA